MQPGWGPPSTFVATTRRWLDALLGGGVCRVHAYMWIHAGGRSPGGCSLGGDPLPPPSRRLGDGSTRCLVVVSFKLASHTQTSVAHSNNATFVATLRYEPWSPANKGLVLDQMKRMDSARN